MGKKVGGTRLREESVHNKLLLIWAIHHGKAKTPILIHENLCRFKTDYTDGLEVRICKRGVPKLHRG